MLILVGYLSRGASTIKLRQTYGKDFNVTLNDLSLPMLNRARDQIAVINREDLPRPVTYQLELLRSVGFRTVELLHKNCCFAAFGAVK